MWRNKELSNQNITDAQFPFIWLCFICTSWRTSWCQEECDRSSLSRKLFWPSLPQGYRAWEQELAAWVLLPALALTCCMTLDNSLHLPWASVSHPLFCLPCLFGVSTPRERNSASLATCRLHSMRGAQSNLFLGGITVKKFIMMTEN